MNIKDLNKAFIEEYTTGETVNIYPDITGIYRVDEKLLTRYLDDAVRKRKTLIFTGYLWPSSLNIWSIKPVVMSLNKNTGKIRFKSNGNLNQDFLAEICEKNGYRNQVEIEIDYLFNPRRVH